MKGFWIFRIGFIASALAFTPVSFPCHGQGTGSTMSVNVPFAFELGDKHFAPGAYTIRTLSSGVIEFHGNSAAGLALVRDEQGSRPSTTSKIVFDRYGDQYFLRQVWVNAGQATYLECPEPKSEKQAKRLELASNSKKPSNVELAMVRLP
jgi:hypothetical protein